MIFEIIKQSMDIRLKMDHIAKIHADTECAVAIGMLAKLYQLPLPAYQTDLQKLVDDFKEQTNALPKTETIEKLEEICYSYEPKAMLDEEKYHLMEYGYEHT